MNSIVVSVDSASARLQTSAYECIEAAIMEAMRIGVDAVDVGPCQGGRSMTVLTFAMSVFYGVEVRGFEPTPADDTAIALAIVAIAAWKSGGEPT